MDLIRQLENKTFSPLKQGEFDELVESNQNGYAVDEHGTITGLCLFFVSLDSLSDSVLPFQGLRQLVLSNVRLKAGDFSPLRQMTSLTFLDLSHNKIDNVSFLGQLTNITQLYLGWNNIKDISPLADLVHLSALDFQNNQLAGIASLATLNSLKIVNLQDDKISDISPLQGLNSIVYLNISGNTVSDIFPLQGLIKLAYLDAARNQIDNISILNGFHAMSYLNLSNNKITDIYPIRGLTGLTVLKLSRNNISDIFSLTALRNLTDLDLGENKISDLTALGGLTGLVKLGLGINQITDLTPLRALTNIRDLRLYINQIADLTPLSALTNLKESDLSGNQIADITPLSALSSITQLGLSGNQITHLTPLSALTNLTALDLSGNQITDLTPLRELKFLIKLDVSNNRIQQFPPEITSWWPEMEIKWSEYYTFGLNLYGNPLTDPPIEIVEKGKAAIENYFAETRQASVLFLESKLLLVGSGDVGKTTLMKKLKDNHFNVVPGYEDTTRGIDIQPWQLSCPFPAGHSRDVNIHFWDFGGQDILHATHQFFLTKRSLYLFVWDPRRDEEIRSFDYWLNAVKLFGAGSPLIMVMNKADIRIKHIDEASFQDKFPNIAQFHQISCVNGQQITELTETIRTALSRMPHLLDRLPKRWMDIRDDLKAREDNYITLEDYFAVCRSHGMDNEKALFLSDYLHDLGIILHFHQDPILAGTVILKPEWATGAVYALIDSLEIQQNKGRFNRAHLKRYWDSKKYPEEKYPQLLRLIEKFELFFNIVGTDDYILPELLPSQRPPIDMDAYRSTGNIRLHYSYDFMPAGIITRFISRIHYLIRDDHYWNNGVELEFSGSFALVVSDAAQKRIRVSVAGSYNMQLMGVIRSHFDHIHESLNMKENEHVFEEVPCNCSECISSDKPFFYNFKTLQKFISKGKTIIPCMKSQADVSIHQLIHRLLLPQEPGKLFDNLVTITSQVQGIKKTLQTDENSRNTVVALLLGTRGFRLKDQTLWGFSASGEKIGELDIKIEDETSRPVSIIETFNLDSFNSVRIDRNVKKLFIHYDISVFKENYILVYLSVKDFEGLCRKYRDQIEHIDYESYELLGGIEEVDTGFSKIKAYRARHRIKTGETVLYHLLAEM